VRPNPRLAAAALSLQLFPLFFPSLKPAMPSPSSVFFFHPSHSLLSAATPLSLIFFPPLLPQSLRTDRASPPWLLFSSLAWDQDLHNTSLGLPSQSNEHHQPSAFTPRFPSTHSSPPHLQTAKEDNVQEV